MQTVYTYSLFHVASVHCSCESSKKHQPRIGNMARNISVIEQLNNLHAATYTGKRHIADSMTDSAAQMSSGNEPGSPE